MRRRFVIPLLLSLATAACGRSSLQGAATASPTPVPSGTATPTATETPAPSSVGDPRASNIALYDTLVADLATQSDSSARQGRVDAFWDALRVSGGAPAHGDGRVIFVLRDASAAPGAWTVAGSFNGWDDAATPLTRIDGTDTLVADVAVPVDSRVSYKFVRAGIWSRDPDGSWVEFDGIDTGGVGAFNSVAFAGASADFGTSELYRFTAHATALANDRDVFVQVPEGYFPARAPLPLLVMHDGNESICRGRFDQVVDDTRAAGGVGPLLVAWVALHDQNERMDEYTFGTDGARGLDYEAFIADELVPAIEARFATPRTPATRAVMGASLGGLISYRIGFDRPDVFALVAGQSSSFFWNDDQMITDVQNGPVHAGRWYLDAGSDDDNGDVALLMKDALDAKGYDDDYVRDPAGQHDWPYWAQRLPGALTYLFGN